MGFLTVLKAIAKVALPAVGAAFLGEAAISSILPDADDASPKAQAAAATAVGPLAVPITAVPTKAGATTLAAIQAGFAPTVAAGMGRNIVITTIDSFDGAGNRVSTEQRRGRPFLMNEDFVTAKRVIKALRKASEKIPRKTVQESPTKALTRTIMAKAIENVTCPPKAGPPC